MMKSITLAGFLALTLAGCAGNPPVTTNLTATERADLDAGKLVKFTTIETNGGDLALNKAKYPNGIYVCASAWAFPTYHCYTDLGKYVGNYLSKRGIKLADTPEKADAVVYFNASLWYEGRYPNPNFSHSLQQMLEKSGTNLNKVETQGAGGEKLLSGLLAESMKFSFLSLMGSGGGYWSNRHWMQLSMVKIEKADIKMVPDRDGHDAVWTKSDAALQKHSFKGRYVGPEKIEKSSIVLFDESLNMALNQIIQGGGQAK